MARIQTFLPHLYLQPLLCVSFSSFIIPQHKQWLLVMLLQTYFHDHKLTATYVCIDLLHYVWTAPVLWFCMIEDHVMHLIPPLLPQRTRTISCSYYSVFAFPPKFFFFVCGLHNKHFGTPLDFCDRVRGEAQFHTHVFILCWHWASLQAVNSKCLE